MDRFFRAIARLVTATTISFGVRPPVLAVFELLRRLSARIVIITQRRLPEYARFFTEDAESQRSDRDSLYESATEARTVESPPAAIDRTRSRTYTPVRTA
jgi:hypothetical protein